MIKGHPYIVESSGTTQVTNSAPLAITETNQPPTNKIDFCNCDLVTIIEVIANKLYFRLNLSDNFTDRFV